jgi:hypothetical protein
MAQPRRLSRPAHPAVDRHLRSRPVRRFPSLRVESLTPSDHGCRHETIAKERDAMTQAANLGFPRIGIKRELKQATEAYWKGGIDAAALLATGAELRRRHWQLQRDVGIAVIPSNDFSFYDQMHRRWR